MTTEHVREIQKSENKNGIVFTVTIKQFRLKYGVRRRELFSNPRTAVSQQLICCDSAYGADDAPFHCRVHRGTRCREP